MIGAVTEETPSLVTPSGINGLQFKDPVASVNEVADQLTDGDDANGEADVVVAEYHEGAPEGTSEGATLEKEVALGGAFASIVNQTSPKVAAIFTAHTHKQYVWDGPVPGAAGRTRPIIQTGSYGETVGRVTMTVNRATGAVSSYTSGLVKRLTATDTNGDKVVDSAEQKAFDDLMVAQYGARVAEVRTIVEDAIAKADVAGKPQVGTVGHDITTAFVGGSYGPGGYTVPNPNDSKVARRPRVGVHAGEHRGEHAARHDGDRPVRQRGDRGDQPGRSARRAVLRRHAVAGHQQGRCGHARRGQLGAAVREQPVHRQADRCAAQGGARAAVADQPRRVRPVATVPAPRAVRQRHHHAGRVPRPW